MTVQFTPQATRASEKIGIEPAYVFRIEGISTIFSANVVSKIIRWGDEGLFFGDDWVYGGSRPIDDQKDYVSLEGSSKSIQQQLYPDKGSVSSVSSVTIRLIDKNREISRVISPGVTITEILGASGELFIGFMGTSFPDDYSRVFRGPISDIISGAGWIEMTLNHPDEKKRSRTYEAVETKLNSAIDLSTTSITLQSVTGLIPPADAIRSFVRIDEELIEYTGITGLTLTGVTRGALSLFDPRSAAAAHEANADVASFYLLEGGVIDLALKLMISGSEEYASSVPIEAFVLAETTPVPDAIYFVNIDLAKDYGLVPGDTIRVTGALTPGNNVTAQIIEIVRLDTGSYATVSAPLTLEADSPAVCAFTSKYDTLPNGLGMDPRDVDVAEHEFIKETFLPSFPMRFYLRDTIENTKEFIEKELYVPCAAYSLPRGTRSSVGLHIAPFPTDTIRILSKDNIENPSKLRLRRSYAKNFYNTIVYRFDEDLYEDTFTRGTVALNATSVEETRRRKDFTINARGMRSNLQAATLAASASSRLLDRYKRGAEFLEQVDIFFSEGVRLEPGDIVVLDPEGLNITDTVSGTRNKPAKFWEVTNKNLDLTGKVTISLTDTSFDGAQRYGMFSPASYIQSGTAIGVVIQASFSKPFGVNEWRKWQDFIGADVQIRSPDYSVIEYTKIAAISGNNITLSPPISFTPLAGYLMEFAPYDMQTSERVKLLYTFNSDGDNPFGDGTDPYVYL